MSSPVLPELEAPPQLPVKQIKVSKRKNATARIRQAAIEVTLPKHWPKAYQEEVTQHLGKRLQSQFQRDFQMVQLATLSENTLTFTDRKTFVPWVYQLNQQTLRVPLQGVRMGHSKHTHLAQMNLQSQVMTVSKYCLRNVPESALRYLIIHELAHLKVPNHSKPFWDEVRRFVPDVKHQRRLIAAVHRIRIYEAELETALPPLPEPAKPESVIQQVLFKLMGR